MCCAYILYCNYFIQANLYKKFVVFFSIEKDYHVINTLFIVQGDGSIPEL